MTSSEINALNLKDIESISYSLEISQKQVQRFERNMFQLPTELGDILFATFNNRTIDTSIEKNGQLISLNQVYEQEAVHLIKMIQRPTQTFSVQNEDFRILESMVVGISEFNKVVYYFEIKEVIATFKKKLEMFISFFLIPLICQSLILSVLIFWCVHSYYKNNEKFAECFYGFSDDIIEKLITKGENYLRILSFEAFDDLFDECPISIKEENKSHEPSLAFAGEDIMRSLRTKKKKGSLVSFLGIFKTLLLVPFLVFQGLQVQIFYKRYSDIDKIDGLVQSFQPLSWFVATLNAKFSIYHYNMLRNTEGMIWMFKNKDYRLNLPTDTFNTCDKTLQALIMNQKATEEISTIFNNLYRGNVCEGKEFLLRYTSAKYILNSEEFSHRCESIYNGVMKEGVNQGLFVVADKIAKFGQILEFYIENKEADWDSTLGGCPTVKDLPKWKNNIRCLMLTPLITDIKYSFRTILNPVLIGILDAIHRYTTKKIIDAQAEDYYMLFMMGGIMLFLLVIQILGIRLTSDKAIKTQGLIQYLPKSALLENKKMRQFFSKKLLQEP